MLAFQTAFIELLVRFEVIRFGSFTLKSGRTSPYFINAGQLRTGQAIAGLGQAFAANLRHHAVPCDMVFGPAYKGIPLAVATAWAASEPDRDVGFGFDRKEAKAHGEGGVLIGTQPADGMRIVVVDDVITSGRSIREAIDLLRRAARVDITGVIVAIDRQERGHGERSTLAELRDEVGVEVYPVATIRDVVETLQGTELGARVGLDAERTRAIHAYLEAHGGTV